MFFIIKNTIWSTVVKQKFSLNHTNVILFPMANRIMNFSIGKKNRSAKEHIFAMQ